MATRRLDIDGEEPPLVGLGHRRELAPWLKTGPVEVECLEIIAEHFFAADAKPALQALAADHALIVHCLGLSLGTPGPLKRSVLDSVAEVAAVADPLWVSDHIGFCRTGEVELGHFISVRPDRENLAIIAEHAREVAEVCGKPILLENITTEIVMRGDLSETEFLNQLCDEAGCGLLLDVTNLFVNCRNRGVDPFRWLAEIEPAHVAQLHVVGYTQAGGHWFDNHCEAIQEDLWPLIREVFARFQPRAVIIERDDAFPAVEKLVDELVALKRAACEASRLATVVVR